MENTKKSGLLGKLGSKKILPIMLAFSLSGCLSSGGSGGGSSGKSPNYQNCSSGTYISNGVNFEYDAFDHEKTQNVSNREEGDYENVISNETLECNNGVVSSQNNFNQEISENNLNANLTNQYIEEELGYTQITDGSVTPEFWDLNSSNELSFIKPLDISNYTIFRTNDLTPSYISVIPDESTQTKPHIPNGEYSENSSLRTSEIDPTKNESKISQIITHPITKSGIEGKIEEINSNSQEGIRGPFNLFLSTLDPRTNTEQAKILTDGVDYTDPFGDIYELNSTNRNLYKGEANLFTDNSIGIPNRLYLTQETNADLDTAERFSVLYDSSTGKISIDPNSRFLTTGVLNEEENYRLVDFDGVLYGNMKVLTKEESCEQDETKRYISEFETCY